MLKNVINLISLKAEEKELELLADIDPEIPINLLGDPLRLGQVLINLSNNAVKFTDRGEIIIRAQQIALDGQGHVAIRSSGLRHRPHRGTAIPPVQSFMSEPPPRNRRHRPRSRH